MIKIIVAHAKRRGIGMNGILPWAIKDDLLNFKKKTIGRGKNSVVMGRRTWESLPKSAQPLNNRHNFIVSQRIDESEVENYSNCEVIKTLDDAMAIHKERELDTMWIIGGSGIYDAALRTGQVYEMHITHIKNDIPCDTFFPHYTMDYACNYASLWTDVGDITYRFEIHRKRSTFAV